MTCYTRHMNKHSVDHKPLADLVEEIQKAGQEVEVGALYGHYKNPQDPYKVTGFAILEATDEVAVLYQVLEGEHCVTFVRPLHVWLETVEWQGRVVPRFTKITSGS